MFHTKLKPSIIQVTMIDYFFNYPFVYIYIYHIFIFGITYYMPVLYTLSFLHYISLFADYLFTKYTLSLLFTITLCKCIYLQKPIFFENFFCVFSLILFLCMENSIIYHLRPPSIQRAASMGADSEPWIFMLMCLFFIYLLCVCSFEKDYKNGIRETLKYIWKNLGMIILVCIVLAILGNLVRWPISVLLGEQTKNYLDLTLKGYSKYMPVYMIMWGAFGLLINRLNSNVNFFSPKKFVYAFVFISIAYYFKSIFFLSILTNSVILPKFLMHNFETIQPATVKIESAIFNLNFLDSIFTMQTDNNSVELVSNHVERNPTKQRNYTIHIPKHWEVLPKLPDVYSDNSFSYISEGKSYLSLHKMLKKTNLQHLVFNRNNSTYKNYTNLNTKNIITKNTYTNTTGLVNNKINLNYSNITTFNTPLNNNVLTCNNLKYNSIENSFSSKKQVFEFLADIPGFNKYVGTLGKSILLCRDINSLDSPKILINLLDKYCSMYDRKLVVGPLFAEQLARVLYVDNANISLEDYIKKEKSIPLKELMSVYKNFFHLYFDSPYVPANVHFECQRLDENLLLTHEDEKQYHLHENREFTHSYRSDKRKITVADTDIRNEYDKHFYERRKYLDLSSTIYEGDSYEDKIEFFFIEGILKPCFKHHYVCSQYKVFNSKSYNIPDTIIYPPFNIHTDEPIVFCEYKRKETWFEKGIYQTAKAMYYFDEKTQRSSHKTFNDESLAINEFEDSFIPDDSSTSPAAGPSKTDTTMDLSDISLDLLNESTNDPMESESTKEKQNTNLDPPFKFFSIVSDGIHISFFTFDGTIKYAQFFDSDRKILIDEKTAHHKLKNFDPYKLSDECVKILGGEICYFNNRVFQEYLGKDHRETYGKKRYIRWDLTNKDSQLYISMILLRMGNSLPNPLASEPNDNITDSGVIICDNMILDPTRTKANYYTIPHHIEDPKQKAKSPNMCDFALSPQFNNDKHPDYPTY